MFVITKRRATLPVTRRLLRDVEFCSNTDVRVDATVSLVQRLPHTIHDIELLLSHTPHRLSREVQYTMLNTLDSLPLRSPDVRRLLPIVLPILANVNSRSAGVWMKAGCLIGDSLLEHADATTRERIVSALIDTLLSASSVHARSGALHGIEHALNRASLKEGKRLLQTVRQVALNDRALSVRRSAFTLLRDAYWWGNEGLPKVHTYAKRIGAALSYPD